jgi:hypothetical protein
MFSGFRIYFSRGVLLLVDRASTPVVVFLGLDVCGVMCGVMCGVFYVLYLLFCSSIFCLLGDLVLLGFDRAMSSDFKKNMVFASFGGSVWARNLW